MNKWQSLLAPILLSMLIVGCGSATVTPQATASQTPQSSSSSSNHSSSTVPSGWKTVSNHAGDYTFSYPNTWKVAGPCVSGPQYAGGVAIQEVVVGPGANTGNCGGDGVGPGQIFIESTPIIANLPLAPPKGANDCGTTTTSATIDGITGQMQTETSASCGHYITYYITASGHYYSISDPTIDNTSETNAAFEALAKDTFKFSAS